MAEFISYGTVEVQLSVAEVALIRRALRLVNPYGNVSDYESALELLADLSAVDE